MQLAKLNRYEQLNTYFSMGCEKTGIDDNHCSCDNSTYNLNQLNEVTFSVDIQVILEHALRCYVLGIDMSLTNYIAM